MTLRRHGYLEEASGIGFKAVGNSPLSYSRASSVKRIVLCDKSVTDPPGKHDTYFAHIERWRRVSKRGGLLKKPVLDEVIPGTEDNCVIAFLDYHKMADNYYYIDYVKTRDGFGGKGNAGKLIDHFYRTHPRATTIHWGKMMRKEIGALKDKMSKRYPKVDSVGGVYY